MFDDFQPKKRKNVFLKGKFHRTSVQVFFLLLL